MSAWASDVLTAPEESKTTESVFQYALRRVDSITCNGENAEEMITLRADSKKIHSIYPSVDPRSFSPAQKSEALSRTLEIFDSPAVIAVPNSRPA